MVEQKPPKIEDAPGLVWRPRQGEWAAYWQARSDLVLRGWKPSVVPLWRGNEPSEFEAAYIKQQCAQLQADMLMFGRGSTPEPITFDGTLKGLCHRYQIDEFSNYPKLQFATRRHYRILMNVLTVEAGGKMLAEFRGPVLMKLHEGWQQSRGMTMAKQLLRMMRTLFSFGFTILEDKDCERLCNVMSKMRFKMPPRRSVWLVAEQVEAIRAHAHTTKYKSIALAQAIQFDGLFRQKDTIGEWLPMSEPGMSDVVFGKSKWLKGIRWEEVDEKLVLRHITSKRGKPIELPLRLCPMVMEELIKITGPDLVVEDEATKAVTINRHLLPAKGPIIVMDTTGRPWSSLEYRNRWREMATAVGVPKSVYNMDSRAGGITEGSDAGVPLEHLRQAAGHSESQTTAGYSRGQATKTAESLKLRVVHRENAKKT